MRQIKMVVRPVEQEAEFDSEVKKLLRRGWKLMRRETLNPPERLEALLYAELERHLTAS